MENKEILISEALRKVELALKSMKYGELMINVQNGKPVLFDKYERQRVGEMLSVDQLFESPFCFYLQQHTEPWLRQILGEESIESWFIQFKRQDEENNAYVQRFWLITESRLMVVYVNSKAMDVCTYFRRYIRQVRREFTIDTGTRPWLMDQERVQVSCVSVCMDDGEQVDIPLPDPELWREEQEAARYYDFVSKLG